jgi:hypothetical protein
MLAFTVLSGCLRLQLKYVTVRLDEVYTHEPSVAMSLIPMNTSPQAASTSEKRALNALRYTCTCTFKCIDAIHAEDQALIAASV